MKAKRNRAAEDRGKSDASWIKHSRVGQAAWGQLKAWRIKHPSGRIAIVDMNAGDGEGIERIKLDLFESNDQSTPTAALAVALAEQDGNADVFLCERDLEKRRKLRSRFPAARVLSDHAQAPNILIATSYEFVLVLSDPCGAADHGIEHLKTIARIIRVADFIVVFNGGWLEKRLMNVKEPTGDPEFDTSHRKAWHTSRKLYGPMLNLLWWPKTLERKHLAASDRVRASNNFEYRILVVTNFPSDAVKREPFKCLL